MTKTYLIPIEERTRFDAIAHAHRRAREERRRFAVRRDEKGAWYVVPHDEPGQEHLPSHLRKVDLGYASVGALVEIVEAF